VKLLSRAIPPALSSGYTLVRPYLATLTPRIPIRLDSVSDVSRARLTRTRARARAPTPARGIRKNDLRSSPISYLAPFPFHFIPATSVEQLSREHLHHLGASGMYRARLEEDSDLNGLRRVPTERERRLARFTAPA